MPGVSADIVLLAVLPAKAPGLIVQLPDGNPFRTTLPVVNAQVGCAIAPTNGAEGTAATVNE